MADTSCLFNLDINSNCLWCKNSSKIPLEVAFSNITDKMASMVSSTEAELLLSWASLAFLIMSWNWEMAAHWRSITAGKKGKNSENWYNFPNIIRILIRLTFYPRLMKPFDFFSQNSPFTAIFNPKTHQKGGFLLTFIFSYNTFGPTNFISY